MNNIKFNKPFASILILLPILFLAGCKSKFKNSPPDKTDESDSLVERKSESGFTLVTNQVGYTVVFDSQEEKHNFTRPYNLLENDGIKILEQKVILNNVPRKRLCASLLKDFTEANNLKNQLVSKYNIRDAWVLSLSGTPIERIETANSTGEIMTVCRTYLDNNSPYLVMREFPDKDSREIDRLFDGQKVELLKKNVGVNNQWHKVLVLGTTKTGYVNKYWLAY